MILDVPMGVSGRYRAFVLDEFGNVERGRGGVPVARDPSGFIRRIGDWHPNLITDLGLDRMISYYFLRGGPRADEGGDNALRYAMAVGDGSTTPATTDTALANEIGVTTGDGGFQEDERISEDAGDILGEWLHTRIYTAPSNVNVSEFAFRHTSSGTEASIRELLRDGSSNPITISLLSGKKLRIDHDASTRVAKEITGLTFEVPEYDTGGNLVTTRTYSANIYAWIHSSYPNFVTDFEPADGTPGVRAGDAVISSPIAVGSSPNLGSGVSASGGVSLPAYVSGSFEKEVGKALTESQANSLNIHNIAFVSTFEQAGWVVALQDGPHPKANTHILELILKRTWSRI